MAKANFKSKQRPSTKRRVSRACLEDLVADLCRRLNDQVQIAEAIEAAAVPTGERPVSSNPMLKVIELAMAKHAAELRQATGFARIIHEQVAR